MEKKSTSRLAALGIGIWTLFLLVCGSDADGACSFVESLPEVPEGQRFLLPWGIAVDRWDRVFVTDVSRGEVKKFDSSGNLLDRWGSSGSGDQELLRSYGIGVDSSGNVFVADTSNGRVQKFDNAGTFLAAWGSEGSGDGQFGGPHGIAVDSSGNILVADTGNRRIQKFDSSGKFLATWGTGELRWPFAVAAAPGGNVWVADMGNLVVQVYDSSGNPVATYGSEGCGGGQFGRVQLVVIPSGGPAGIAFDSSGNVFVTDPYNRRVQKLSSSWDFLGKWGYVGDGDGEFCRPDGIAVESFVVEWLMHIEMYVYVADTGNNRIQKFDGSGNLVVQWGSEGSGEGEFQNPRGIAVSGGNVFVADTENHRIQKFDSDGNFLTQWGSQGSGDGQFSRPCGVSVGESGNVYVADTENQRVQKFDSSGNPLARWGSRGTADGEFGPVVPVTGTDLPQGPGGITVDSPGNVFAADTWNNRIQKFDSSGNFLGEWSSQNPWGVAVDSWGRVFVTDIQNSRVDMFHSSGSLLYTWGGHGIADGEFMSPKGIGVDARGNVFVADTGNSRIQRFERDFAIERIVRSDDTVSLEFHLRGPGYFEIWGAEDGLGKLSWAPLIGVGSPAPLWGVRSWTDDGQHMLGPAWWSRLRFYRIEN